MILKVTCPCGCGHTFDVDVPKGSKGYTDEERAKRAERMKAMRAAGVGGRPKGVKESKPRKTRSDKGKARLSRQAKAFLEQSLDGAGILDMGGTNGDMVQRFTDMVQRGANDPKGCPLSMGNGGPCDGVHIDAYGRLTDCTSMQECYFDKLKYMTFVKKAK